MAKLKLSSRSVIISVSKTKFYHAVAVLPQEVVSQILDLIRAPPPGDPYEVLREWLITPYTLNDYQPFEALVSFLLSGDQKSLHLMNRMLALFPYNYKPDFILREKVSDPGALAFKADECSQSRVSSSVNLLSEVLEDSLQVSAVSSRSWPSLAPLFKRSLTPASSSRSSRPPGACWFHKKHGDKAVSCRKPCLVS